MNDVCAGKVAAVATGAIGIFGMACKDPIMPKIDKTIKTKELTAVIARALIFMQIPLGGSMIYFSIKLGL